MNKNGGEAKLVARASLTEDGSHRSTAKDESKYKLLAELGRGGMANVYLAVARGPNGFNKLVVLKCLRSDMAHDPELVAMFLDEARLAARLNHPHVVQTYEVGDYLGHPVIVMEYLDGQTLASLVHRAAPTFELPLPLHLRVIIDALEGLHHAHELTDYDGTGLNLVHRDVSPHNVFVTFDGQVKVLDFGIAKAATSQSQTATGILKGKVPYMPPEQMLAAPLDRRADIYAVGVMIWEAVAGRRMWKGMTDIHIMNKVVNEGVQSLRECNPNVDPELEAIVLKALARDPAERYSTALELAGALEAFVARLGTGASNRNLAKVMHDLFHDARARTQEIIEAQLLEARATTSEAQLISPNIPRLSVRPEGPDAARVTTAGSNAMRDHVGSPLERRSRRGFVAARWAGGALAAVIALVSVRECRRGSSKLAVPNATRTTPGPQMPLSASSVAPIPVVTAKKVSLVITSTPPHASLFLDGRRLASTPFSALLTSDEVTHQVRLEAPGFMARTIDVVPDRDIRLVVALDALPDRGTPRAKAPAPPAVPDGRPGSFSDQNKSCSPPYNIDADGIKKFKPECL